MLKIKLKLRMKNGTERIVVFENATDIYIDYEKNTLVLFDYDAGVDYKYHFKEKGNERESEAVAILDIEIVNKEEYENEN